jgi:hypothetical protein
LLPWDGQIEGTDEGLDEAGVAWVSVKVWLPKETPPDELLKREMSRKISSEGSAISVHLDRDTSANINYRMLASKFNPMAKSFLVPKDYPLPLLLLRVIFTRLRKQAKDDAPSEKLPFEAFQRSFERLFFVLQDPDGLNLESILEEYDENGDGFVAWSEFYHLYRKKERDFTVRRSLRERIYIMFDNPESSHLAMIISTAMLAVIMVSSSCFILSTVSDPDLGLKVNPDDGTPSNDTFLKIEMVCLVLFTIEYVVRLGTVGAVRKDINDQKHLIDLVTGYHPIYMPSPPYKMLRFVFTFSNIIDLAAILPALLSLIPALEELNGGGFVVLRLVRLTRIFRVFKNPAIVEQVMILSRTIQQSTKALYVLGFNLVLGIVIFGSLMYLAENTGTTAPRWDQTTQRWQRLTRSYTWPWNNSTETWERTYEPSPFQSIPLSFWWAIVTVMTVGYGDHAPNSLMGFVVAIVAMCFSLVILALPVGLIGGKFSQVWAEVAMEKVNQAEEREKELFDMTSEVLRFDPSVLNRMMLIQVWNDTDSDWQPDTGQSGKHRFDFMGEAKLELAELGDTEFVSPVIDLELMPNESILKRSVAGSVKIMYQWRPQSSEILRGISDRSVGLRGAAQASKLVKEDTLEGAPPTSSEGVVRNADVIGTLKVTVLSADDLINLDFARPSKVSSPFCTVLAYPVSPNKDCPLRPHIWRSPTVQNNLCPQWPASHDFHFDWPESKVQMRHDTPASLSTKQEAAPNPKTEDDVVSVLFALEDELKAMRAHLRSLSSRVDSIMNAGGPAPIDDEAAAATAVQ